MNETRNGVPRTEVTRAALNLARSIAISGEPWSEDAGRAYLAALDELDAIEQEAARPLPESTEASDELRRWISTNATDPDANNLLRLLAIIEGGALPDRPEPSLNVERLAWALDRLGLTSYLPERPPRSKLRPVFAIAKEYDDLAAFFQSRPEPSLNVERLRRIQVERLLAELVEAIAEFSNDPYQKWPEYRDARAYFRGEFTAHEVNQDG